MEEHVHVIHHHHLVHMPVRHGWLKFFIKNLESDPMTQYKVHLWAVRLWLLNMVVALSVFTFLPHVWQVASVLYLVLVSLYANLATDYGSMSSAIAAQHGSPLPEIPAEPPRPDLHG